MTALFAIRRTSKQFFSTAYYAAQVIVACMLLVSACLVQAQEQAKEEEPKFQISDAIPEGFESLMDAQTLVVTVRYNEENVGSALVTADAETLTFEEPDALVELLDGIRTPERLKLLLTETYPTNGHLVCYSRDEPKGCGQVEADPVAIIYNSDILILDLYLESSLQTVQAYGTARFLPPPDEKITSVLSLDLLSSDTSDGEYSVDLATYSISSYGSGNIVTALDYNTRTRNTRLRTARLQHLYKKNVLSVGNFPFDTGATLGNLDIIGASFESSLSTRVDLDDAFSSVLTVYLPRRSQVLMVVDGRSYISESYAAGNQSLNTRSLPRGTYEVEIRIIDPVTGIRTEKRLFTKSTSMPPRGETIFGLTFGSPVALDNVDIVPEMTDISLGGMTVSRRLTDQSAWRLGVVGLNDIAITEAQYLALGTELSFHLSLAQGSEDIRAGTASLGYSSALLSLNLSASWFNANEVLYQDPSLREIFPEAFVQYTGSWTRAFKDTAINARFSKQTAGITPENRKSVEEFSVEVKHLLYKKGTFRFNLNLEYQKNNAGETFGIGLVASTNESRARSELGLQLRNAPNDDGTHLAHIAHNVLSAPKNPIIWDADIRGEVEEKTEALGISVEIEDKKYLAAFNSDWNSIEADQSTRNSAFRISTHLGIDSRGFAMGGTDIGQSGFIVHLRGKPSDEIFDIYVNNLKSGVTRAGEIKFLGLPPLEEYTVKIVPRTSITSALDENEFRFTVFPGAVYRITTDIVFRLLLVASIEDENGEVVRNGFIPHERSPALVDADGFIQAEVTPGERLTVTRPGKPDCVFIAPLEDDQAMLVLDTPLTCRVNN